MPKPLKSGSTTPKHLENVACPFCSLLCDDLSLTVTDDNIVVGKNGCRQAKLGFERNPIVDHPQIEGKRASQKAAIVAAAGLLRRAHRPLISGLGTDVEGMREAVHLAEKSKAIIDHGNSAGFDSGMRVLQSKGWYLTTLAELRNRADLVVVVGADIVNHYENFRRRYLEPKKTLHPDRRKQRRVFYIGPKATAPSSTKALVIEAINCGPSSIVDVLAMLRARIAGRTLQLSQIAKARMREIDSLAGAIKNAQYPVFVWAPGHFEGLHADLAIQSITRIVDDLNHTQRAAGLALGGDNGGMSAANVCTWLTGYPLHVSFAGQKIDYDPVQYRTDALIKNEAIDVLVWIDAFGRTAPPPTSPGVKRIVIGLAGTNLIPNADVFIPIGTPGVDHSGKLVRTDAVVSLQLDQVRAQLAPSVRKVVHAIVEQL